MGTALREPTRPCALGPSTAPITAAMSGLKTDNGDITVVEKMLSSSVGAVLTSAMMTPFDVVKTRLQWQAHIQIVHSPSCAQYVCHGFTDHLCICAAETKPSPKFRGTVDAFIKIRQLEGASSLWRGLSPTLLMSVPSTVIYFTSYEYLRMLFGSHAVAAPLLAGALARMVAATAISPLEMMRTKLQAGAASGYHELFVVARRAVQREGVTSLWRGLGPTLLRDVPFSAIYWASYEALRDVMRASEPSSHGVHFAAAAACGAFAAVVTLPFDVVKTRQQVMLGEAVAAGARMPTRNTFSIMREIVRRGGLGGLFVGITPRVAKVAPACAIMMTSYEWGKDFFRNRRAERGEPG